LETLALNFLMLRAGAAAVNENIEHLYLVCEYRDKPDMLRKLLHAFERPSPRSSYRPVSRVPAR
jgi:hypothetical protein